MSVLCFLSFLFLPFLWEWYILVCYRQKNLASDGLAFLYFRKWLSVQIIPSNFWRIRHLRQLLGLLKWLWRLCQSAHTQKDYWNWKLSQSLWSVFVNCKLASSVLKCWILDVSYYQILSFCHVLISLVGFFFLGIFSYGSMKRWFSCVNRRFLLLKRIFLEWALMTGLRIM